jgi:hypothetical protein
MKKSLIVFGLCAAATLFAQGPPPGRLPGHMGPGGPGAMMGMMGMAGRTVTGAPYSAQEVTEQTQTLANGNVISHKLQANVYRDSSGRVRTERTVPAGWPGQGEPAAQAATKTVVSIHDPVAGVASELDTAAKTARQMTLPNHGGNPAFQGNRQGHGTIGAADPNVVTETLPMQTINGVQATGTRVTRTIPAGQVGNAQPMQRVTETWYSSDLQRNVMVKVSDPRQGTIVTQLTNITRAEPDPALFQVPADYTVTKGHSPRFGNQDPAVARQ